ncbi:transglycosylase SLT domain-containing protein [Halomonas chromatireducens]|uniref:Soluble lytic murein transglycosylase n=1 Tax=Halomonas chromatireducens TaxID=507626 RepID=A0A0X8HC52_9GAMM|nr:transglycosylase SLT domain-containing protein [Halomonas chromatireducens]AMC99942.1 Soluble lytic murein transglycosylase precursor [Halomonas chromatireducens]
MRHRHLLNSAAAWFAAAAISLPLVAHAQPSDSAMREALEAARNQQWSRINSSTINDHVLYGYVEYHRLRDQLPQAEPSQILAFIERHKDAPLAEWMRGQAISRYGSAGRYGAVLAVADGEPAGAERQCHYYTALLGSDPEAAAQGGRKLWHVGSSQSSACDPLFRQLRETGEISEVDIWERKMLAWQQGESGLASYLGRQLGSRWQEARDAKARLQGNYAAITQVPNCIGPECLGSGALFAAAMHGFTRADTEAAMEAWRKVAPYLTFDGEHRHAIEEDLAFYSLVRNIDNNRGWVDDILPRVGTARVLELRVRHALSSRDWSGALRWIEAMPDETRDNSRWQYWKARAHEQLGDTERAQVAYARAADGRNFFAFAASDRLNRPYSLNLERNGFDEAYRQEVAQWPAVQRTEALLRIGEDGLANSEWLNAVAIGTPREARALADYAARRGWHARLVQTTITGQMWDALDWRFPEAYRDYFLRWGNNTGVDPYLLMGIARRESAYNPTALSPAGARGLMQIMPGTATQLSRQLGISDPGSYGVLDPELNIRLGSTYIRDMTDRYRGNRLAAAAAYNAGPGRVDRWLRDSPEEFDLFVESIPFRETRDYVQAVLAYRVIFESLANGGSTEGVSMLSSAETTVRYDGSLLARN